MEIITFADMAARLGLTEDQLRQRIADAPRRQREAMEKICSSPKVRAYMEEQIRKMQKKGEST